METPRREAIVWPMRALRGWEKGDSIARENGCECLAFVLVGLCCVSGGRGGVGRVVGLFGLEKWCGMTRLFFDDGRFLCMLC